MKYLPLYIVLELVPSRLLLWGCDFRYRDQIWREIVFGSSVKGTGSPAVTRHVLTSNLK